MEWLELTPALLREIGEALYGTSWQAAFARQMGVSDRTVRRWAAGAFRIPEHLRDDLAGILRERRTSLAELLRRL